jgi:hypothetical protein
VPIREDNTFPRKIIARNAAIKKCSPKSGEKLANAPHANPREILWGVSGRRFKR